MQILTLTTDLGLRDFYVPSVKGRIYAQLPNVNIVDITHQVKPFNLAEAAFILGNAFHDFPSHTVHLVSIESDFDSQGEFILAFVHDQYFIAKNNGLISLLTDEPPQKVRKIKTDSSEAVTFPLKYLMVDVAVQIVNGTSPDEIGVPSDHTVARANLRPILMENIIRGTIIYVDNFGNAIINIDRATLERYKNFKHFRVNYNKKEYINEIKTHYEEVPEGEVVSLFGSSGYLEIAINKGDAGQLLGLKTGHTIIIECE